MPLEIKEGSLKPGVPRVFTFSGPVYQRLVGIQGFNLYFTGDGDHHVKTASISLNINSSDKNVTVTANEVLANDGDATTDTSYSHVDVAVVAWTGANGDNLRLTNVRAISAGKRSEAISLPDTTPNILRSILSGFNFSYSSGDHHVRTIEASVGNDSDGTSAYITADGEMYNNDGDHANTTIDGALLANCETSFRFEIQEFKLKNNEEKIISFSNPVTNFESFITGYKLQFDGDDDHHVKGFGASAEIYINNAGQRVIRGWLIIQNKEDSGNRQNDDESFVSGFIIGY